MEDTNHARKEFEMAVDYLVGLGDIRQRLYNAYLHHLVSVTEKDLPPHLVVDFKYIEGIVEREEATGSEGTALPSINSLNDDEAVKMAQTITKIAFELTEED